jgi:hypothetical protein
MYLPQNNVQKLCTGYHINGSKITSKRKCFEKWRPKRPYESLVESLKRGLERIDKHAEADLAIHT